jgi:hypothetical protein
LFRRLFYVGHRTHFGQQYHKWQSNETQILPPQNLPRKVLRPTFLMHDKSSSFAGETPRV